MKSCITLLLLLCCSPCKMQILSEDHKLSGQQKTLEIQSEKREISRNKRETEDQKTATATTSIQQVCQTDIISALLIQMSTTLAEQRAELRNTKTEISNLETRLRFSENLVEQLQKDNEVSKVAFSASLLGAGGDTNIGPVNTRITLIYRHIFTNIGKAYNPNTGIFTAPVKGVYHLKIYIYAMASSTNPITTSLMKNGQQILVAHSHQAGPQVVSSSNGASLELEAGDVVYVQLWENRIIVDNANCHSTFSGHLLFPL